MLALPIWASDSLTLDHKQKIISFGFSTLSYGAPHKNQYRYQLEGFDDGWTEVDSERRSATYTNLPSGSYTLRVQGSTSDGLWGDQEARLRLIILPPWWETTWFRLLIGLTLAGLVYVGYRWRVSAIKARNRELEAQVNGRTQELATAKEAAEEARYVAEAANRAKSAFLANMSHELRSPLNAILGFAQVMARNGSLSPDDHENIGIITRSGEHLLSLINQVLDLSKIEAGRITLNASNFDFYGLLDDIGNMLALKAEEKGLRLLIERSDDVPRYIRTDDLKLRQVLINLLGNAVKFTAEGGVTLRVGVGGQPSAINRQPSGDAPRTPYALLRFEVEDTGPGIAPQEIDSLFEAFAQTESGRQVEEGTGLGLPISRRFVQLLGGDISVKSEPGHGTLFSFDIQVEPIAADQITAHETQNRRRIIALAAEQPRYRLLIVDDDPINRQLLVKLLNPLGFALKEAENGQQAVDLWREWRPHLIWMDIRMPVMDGYVATRCIKSSSGGQDTAIVALTASSFEEDRDIVLSAGCDDFMRKPFREADIFEMMGKHIGVQYIYEDPDPAQISSASSAQQDATDWFAEIAALPVSMLDSLRQGVELGDMDQIDRTIRTINTHNPKLAEQLAGLAYNVEYEKLLALVQTNSASSRQR